MLILYPRLPNGNILWTCDNCNETAQVSCADTNAVALICMCDGKVHPECNNDWYNQGLYLSKHTYKERMGRYKEHNER